MIFEYFKDPKVWDFEGSLHSTEGTIKEYRSNNITPIIITPILLGIIVELTKQLMEEVCVNCNCYFPLFLETKVMLRTITTWGALCREIIISFETYRLKPHKYH